MLRIVVHICRKDNDTRQAGRPAAARRTVDVKLINRYLLREFAPFFSIALAVTAFVLILDKLLKYVSFVLGNHLDSLSLLRMLSYTLATVSGLVLPIAFLIASILTWNRLSTDSEYVALQAAGVSLYRLLQPLFLLAVAAYIAATFLLLYGAPWGFQGLRRLTFEVARRQAHLHLHRQEFHDAFQGLVLYADAIHPENQQLEGIFIADARSTPLQVLTARSGELIVQPEALQVILRLHDGEMHRDTVADEPYYRLRFGRYDIRLELDTDLARRARRATRPREWFPSQLWHEMARQPAASKRYAQLLLFWHQQVALPFTCLIFAALGPVLGVVRTRTGRAGGYVLGGVAILVYYAFFTAGSALGEGSVCPAWLAAWLPNLCFAALTGWLLRQTVVSGGRGGW